ncbi:MAG: IPT/TIG domain-containing protein [Deltaproteobacteria bacterium]|nr:IPT/TIG domain-containing protein [Deltaproteobacteria bacterium]
MTDGATNYQDTHTDYSDYVWPVRGGQGGTISLPKTGQTFSYASGDDGDLQKGTTWSSPRFTDNGNGTVSDNMTDLVWLKKATCFKVPWSDALYYAKNLASGQYGPSITSFTPTSGGAGTSVTITGTNLTGAASVYFGGTAAQSFTGNSATQITAVVGAGATGAISVTTPSGSATSSSIFTLTSPNPTPNPTPTPTPDTKTNYEFNGDGKADILIRQEV